MFNNVPLFVENHHPRTVVTMLFHDPKGFSCPNSDTSFPFPLNTWVGLSVGNDLIGNESLVKERKQSDVPENLARGKLSDLL